MITTGLLVMLFIAATTALPATSHWTKSPSPLKVATFNIQSFGRSKMSNNNVAGQIAKILQRHDLVLIQEVRDSSGEALERLKSRLGSGWDYVSSDPLGRTSYKEQYAFFYRTAFVEITSTYQWDDTAHDYYEREPFAIEIQYFSTSQNDNRHMALVGLHTRPVDTPSELQHLPDVIRFIYDNFTKADGVIAMGDFNADCSYLNSDLRKNLEIFNPAKGFSSEIDESVDTTVSHSTHCAYDRVITFGMTDVRNVHVYNFEMAMDLMEEEARAISDHYPVELSLY